ncbi:hypothetical protein [Parendozoicomonas haliclonae]|uniref:Uncharacterized protein n=1 Tax=Parendozoicomonas haliclonae TaxID=1960125 RepID=A0A1X7AEI5_9GAMM|nr:hypothetical protein [Parendozoicomonas haliclonae]SMA32938.1 hypothetical protein EHSB41UT_00210 [Parendozoicomonas haliclonae]
MTLYKVHEDAGGYQSLTLDIDDFLDLLDPHIGEAAAMQLGKKNISIRAFWKPLELGYYRNEGAVSLADISIWRSGGLLLNQKAFNALKEVLTPFGEILPCELHGNPAFFFNCLNLKPTNAAQIRYRMHQDIYAEVESITFLENERDDVFKHENKVSFTFYCSQKLVEAYKQADLRGLAFTENLIANVPI